MVCFLAFNREASGSTGSGGREVGIGGGKGQGPALSPPQGKEGRENPGRGYHAQIAQPRGVQAPLLGPGLTIASNRSPEQALCGARGHVHTVPSLLPLLLLSGSTGPVSASWAVWPQGPTTALGLSHTGKPDRLHPCSRCDVEASGWSSWVRSPSTDSQLWPENGVEDKVTVPWSPQRGLLRPAPPAPHPHPLPCPGRLVRPLWLCFW